MLPYWYYETSSQVVRQVSIDDALSLAANHKRHDWYLTMMIENKKDFAQALDYIEDLEFEDADNYMKKYGHRLMQHVPEQSTKFLKCEYSIELLFLSHMKDINTNVTILTSSIKFKFNEYTWTCHSTKVYLKKVQLIVIE